MDFVKTLLVLLKRWYVALPVFLVTVGVTVAVYLSVPIRYSSTGTLVLTAPTAGPSSQAAQERGQTNPLLAFDSSLSITASIVIQGMGTPSVAAELGSGPNNTYEVSSGELGGPFIVVKTESTSAEQSVTMVNTVVDRVRQELDTRQHTLKAPPSTFIKADTVVPASTPEKLLGGKMRAAGAAFALGLFASLTAVFAVESIAARRRRSAAADDDTAEPDGSAAKAAAEPAEELTLVMPKLSVAASNGRPSPTRLKDKQNGTLHGKVNGALTLPRGMNSTNSTNGTPSPWPTEDHDGRTGRS